MAKEKLTRAKRDAARRKALSAARKNHAAAAEANPSESSNAPHSAPSSCGSSSDGAESCLPRHVKACLAKAASDRGELRSKGSAQARPPVVTAFQSVENLSNLKPDDGETAEVVRSGNNNSRSRRGFSGRPALRSPRDKSLKTTNDKKHRSGTGGKASNVLVGGRAHEKTVRELVIGLGPQDESLPKQTTTTSNASFQRPRVLRPGDEDPLLEMVGSIAVQVHSNISGQLELGSSANKREGSSSWNPGSALPYGSNAMPSNVSDANLRLQKLQQIRQQESRHFGLPKSAPTSSAAAAAHLHPNGAGASAIRAAARGLSTNEGTTTSHTVSSSLGNERHQPYSGKNFGTRRVKVLNGFRVSERRLMTGYNDASSGGFNATLAARCFEAERAEHALHRRAS